MNKCSLYSPIICTLLLVPVSAQAATAYINDRLMVGLHRERSADSVIIRVIPTGTPLEVLQKESGFTQVRDPDGITGWVDNQYLVEEPPTKAQLQQAELRIQQLEEDLQKARLKLAGLEDGTQATETAGNEELQTLRDENKQLEEKYKSEKLRVGELQAEVASLKNKLSNVKAPPADQERIDQLITENRMLTEKLAAQQDVPSNITPSPGTGLDIDVKETGWRTILIVLGVTLLAGFLLGLFVLDFINRKRHGGFRV